MITNILIHTFLKLGKKISSSLSGIKRIAKIGSVIALLFSLSGCGTDAESDKIRIGVAIPNFDDTFMVGIKDAIQKHGDKVGNVELIIVDAKEDTVKQLGQIQNFIIQQVDGIIIVPVNTDATQPMTDSIRKAGIELVYLNRQPGYLPEGVSYVGSDEMEFGRVQARYAEEITGSGNIGILMGLLTNEGALLRTQGIEEYFADNNQFNVIRKQTGLWQRAQAMSVMENWINSGDKLDIILSNNDDMALGAIQALKAVGKLDNTLVVGIDATPDGIQAVKDGLLDATVFQDSIGQGQGAVDVILKSLNKETFSQITMIPAELVTQDTLAEFLNKG